MNECKRHECCRCSQIARLQTVPYVQYSTNHMSTPTKWTECHKQTSFLRAHHAVIRLSLYRYYCNSRLAVTKTDIPPLGALRASNWWAQCCEFQFKSLILCKLVYAILFPRKLQAISDPYCQAAFLWPCLSVRKTAVARADWRSSVAKLAV